MMEDILTNLQKIGELEVKSRTDVEQYRETTKTVAVIGSELQVAFILGGSVRKIGDDLRITAQLIDVNTGDYLWADMYDGKYTEEIFDFQSNIARKVANALHASITPKEEERIEKIPTTDITAYDLCKRASNEINRHWLREGNENTLKLARKLINGALEIDPNYIQALSLMGRLCIAEKKLDSLYFYAKRIIEIDPEESEGYWLMGRHHEFKDEIDEAIDNYQLAIKYLKPEAEDIHLSRAQLEVSLGQLYFRHKHDVLNALSHYQKAFDFNTDPDFMPAGNLAFIFSIIGDYERAEMYGKKLIEMAPKLDGWYILLQGPNLQRQGKYNQSINFLDSMSAISIRNHPITYGLFLNHLLLGNLDQAEQYYNQWLNLGGGTKLQNAEDFAYLYKKLGKDQEAINMLNEGRAKWEEIPKNDRYAGTLASLSTIYALLDKKEESLKYLSQAVEKGKGCSYWRIDFETDPRFENLWDDPEFKAIMKRLKDKKQALQEEVRKMRNGERLVFN